MGGRRPHQHRKCLLVLFRSPRVPDPGPISQLFSGQQGLVSAIWPIFRVLNNDFWGLFSGGFLRWILLVYLGQGVYCARYWWYRTIGMRPSLPLRSPHCANCTPKPEHCTHLCTLVLQYDIQCIIFSTSIHCGHCGHQSATLRTSSQH